MVQARIDAGTIRRKARSGAIDACQQSVDSAAAGGTQQENRRAYVSETATVFIASYAKFRWAKALKNH